jgi:hypothetical protein
MLVHSLGWGSRAARLQRNADVSAQVEWKVALL